MACHTRGTRESGGEICSTCEPPRGGSQYVLTARETDSIPPQRKEGSASVQRPSNSMRDSLAHVVGECSVLLPASIACCCAAEFSTPVANIDLGLHVDRVGILLPTNDHGSDPERSDSGTLAEVLPQTVPYKAVSSSPRNSEGRGRGDPDWGEEDRWREEPQRVESRKETKRRSSRGKTKLG